MKTDTPKSDEHGTAARNAPWPAAEHAAEGTKPPPNPAAAAFSAIPSLLGEIRLYVSHYIAAKTDRLKLTVRTAIIYAGLGVMGLIVLAAVVGTAVALLLAGLAHGLGTLLWHQLWLGDVIVGLLVLGSIALTVYLALSRMSKASRKQMEQKYEGKRIQQRVEHGRDVHDRAASAGKHGRQQSKT